LQKANVRRNTKKKKALRLNSRVGLILTALLAVSLTVAVCLMPSPKANKAGGGIEFVGMEQEAQIFGPELPAEVDENYVFTSVNRNSVVAGVTGETDVTYYYAAVDGECYHTGNCKFAYASSQRLTLYEATFLGYRACGACEPPIYGQVQVDAGADTAVQP